MMNQYYKPLIVFIIGGIIGISILILKTPSKKYPVTVQCYWETNGYQSYPSFECDSIKGDTCYKDGVVLVTKNIINVRFN
jgi:hypothetical protein